MTVSVSKRSPITAQGPPLLSARKQLDIVTAYREVGTYRGAAEMCGVTHKTVKRVVERAEAAAAADARRRNYESVRALVAAKIDDTKGKISAKRLLPLSQGGRLRGLGPQLPAAGRAGTQQVPAGAGAGTLLPPGGVGAG